MKYHFDPAYPPLTYPHEVKQYRNLPQENLEFLCCQYDTGGAAIYVKIGSLWLLAASLATSQDVDFNAWVEEHFTSASMLTCWRW